MSVRVYKRIHKHIRTYTYVSVHIYIYNRLVDLHKNKVIYLIQPLLDLRGLFTIT